jgi:DMSO/TMAO reductase YedYZ molybdopterin-dependent catalytic subunit
MVGLLSANPGLWGRVRIEEKMRRPTPALGALIGGLTSLPVIALSFLGWQLAELPFLPFDLFDWLARTLPGDVVRLGIDGIVRVTSGLRLGSTSTAAKTIEQLLALGMAVAGGAVLGMLVALITGRDDRPDWRVGARVGLLFLILSILIELDLGLLKAPLLALLWLALLMVGWGALVGQLLHIPLTPVPEEVRADRRAALIKIAGGSAFVALSAWGFGRWLGSAPKETGASQPLANLEATPQAATPEPSTGTAPPETPLSSPPPTTLPEVTATATQLDRIPPAPGTRLELTPTEDFYRIDINTRPVAIEGESWTLKVEGLFDNPRPLTLTDLMAYPPVTQPVTMGCISNRIGGDLIGTSNWTGARLREVLKDLGLRPEANELFVEGADGFFESVAQEDLMDPRTRNERRNAAREARLSLTHLHPQPLRDETAEMDQTYRGDRARGDRLLGEPGLERRGTPTNRLGDRHRGAEWCHGRQDTHRRHRLGGRPRYPKS